MQEIKIQQAVATDLHRLQQISRDTFVETFSESNTEENMRKYVADAFTTDKLREELNDPESVFYLAEYDGRVVGYLKINSGNAQTEMQDSKALEIERIYVLQKFQGRKAGRQLFERALQSAKERNSEFIWLGVWEENFKAINFYKKNGFVEFGKHIFRLGDDEQTDILMKLTL